MEIKPLDLEFLAKRGESLSHLDLYSLSYLHLYSLSLSLSLITWKLCVVFI
jgi:hypothetical protein